MTGLPWESEEEYEPPPEAEDWRGTVHPDSWPEHLAGPEYWLYRSEVEDAKEDEDDTPKTE